MYVSFPFRILNYFRIFSKFFKHFAIERQPQNLHFYYQLFVCFQTLEVRLAIFGVGENWQKLLLCSEMV
jgi:hypothetical protein